jgi:hypothetical protein
MSDILKRHGFTDPLQVATAIAAHNVRVAKPPIPRRDLDMMPVMAYHQPNPLPFRLGTWYQTPRRSGRYE